MMISSLVVVVTEVTKETQDAKYRDGNTIKVELLQICRLQRLVEQFRFICACFVHFDFLESDELK